MECFVTSFVTSVTPKQSHSAKEMKKYARCTNQPLERPHPRQNTFAMYPTGYPDLLCTLNHVAVVMIDVCTTVTVASISSSRTTLERHTPTWNISSKKTASGSYTDTPEYSTRNWILPMWFYNDTWYQNATTCHPDSTINATKCTMHLISRYMARTGLYTGV